MTKLLVSLLVISLIAVSAMGETLRARLADRRSKLNVMERAMNLFKAEKNEMESQQYNNILNTNGNNFLNQGGNNFLNQGGNNFLNNAPTKVACANNQSPTADTTGGDRFFAPAGPGTPKMLYTNQQLRSHLGMYVLAMQGDCNLVLYYANAKPTLGPATWATGTYGQGSGCTAQIDGNGILTVVTGSGVTLWSSAHQGSSANAASGSNKAWVSAAAGQGQTAAYIVQDDGNFVAYQCSSPYWATMTQGRTYLELQDTMKSKYNVNAIPHNILEGIKRGCFGDDQLLCQVGSRIPMGHIPREQLNFFDE